MKDRHSKISQMASLALQPATSDFGEDCISRFRVVLVLPWPLNIPQRRVWQRKFVTPVFFLIRRSSKTTFNEVKLLLSRQNHHGCGVRPQA
jgi:hypothetical protein